MRSGFIVLALLFTLFLLAPTPAEAQGLCGNVRCDFVGECYQCTFSIFLNDRFCYNGQCRTSDRGITMNWCISESCQLIEEPNDPEGVELSRILHSTEPTRVAEVIEVKVLPARR